MLIRRIFLPIFFFIFLNCQSNTVATTLFENKVDVPRVEHYQTLSYIVKALSLPLKKEIFLKDTESFTEPLVFMNRTVLYGSSLDSQKILAQEIAKISDCSYVSMNLREFAGESIEELFEKAINISRESEKRIIIFIEGLDYLISTQSEFNSEYAKFAWELRDHLERHKYDPRVFVVCGVKDCEKLDPKLLSHFPYYLRIAVGKLNAKSRREILSKLFEKYEIEVDNKIMDGLVECSDAMSVLSLEDFTSYIKTIVTFESSVKQSQFIEIMKSRNKRGFSISDEQKMIAALIALGVGCILFKQCFEDSQEELEYKLEYARHNTLNF